MKLFDWINKELAIRLVTRFTLADVPLVKMPFRLLRTVQPITNFDELLATSKSDSTNKDLSAAAGTYVPYFTVPAGKRWLTKLVYRASLTANNYPIFRVDSKNVVVGILTSTLLVIDHQVHLNPGDSIGQTTTGNAADNARVMDIIYEEEDAY